MKISWSNQSIVDLESIEKHIAQENPTAATRVIIKVLKLIEQTLTEFPGIGKPGRKKDTREFVIPKIPYTIIYKTNKNTLYMVRIFHHTQSYL